MGFDITSLKQNVESYQGEPMANLLKGIDVREHLGIIRQLAQAESGNKNLTFNIEPGSTPTHFKYSIVHNDGGNQSAHQQALDDTALTNLRTAFPDMKFPSTITHTTDSAPIIAEEFDLDSVTRSLTYSNVKKMF